MNVFFTRTALIFLLISFSTLTFGQLEILKTPDLAPTIDGIISPDEPWKLDNWEEQTMLKDGSTDQISSRFQLLWDDNNLYLAVEIDDATPNWDNVISYQNDCVETFFHMDGGSVEGTEVTYTQSTHQLRFPRGESTHGLSGTSTIVLLFQEDENAKYAVESDASGWTLEAQLPFDMLDVGGNFDGENFMFEINASDNTGETRTGILFWQNNSDDQWRYVETFSPVHLSSEAVVNNTSFYSEESHTMCSGESYTWRENGYTESGRYFVTFTAVDGSDSIYGLDLNVVPPYFNQQSVSICEGTSYSWRGQVLTVADTYYDTYTSSIGCDSIYALELSLSPAPEAFSITGQSEASQYDVLTYSAPVNPQVDYEWFITGGNMVSAPSDNAVEVQWGEEGQGSVAAIAKNSAGCESDTIELSISIATNLNEVSRKALVLYPNPAGQSITIKNVELPSYYTIVDIYGKEVQKGFVGESSGHIDISLLKEGMYFFSLEDKRVYKLLKVSSE